MTNLKKVSICLFTAFIGMFIFNVPVFAVAGMSESESNNTASTAVIIPSDYDLTQEIGGSIGYAGDVDYYKFVPLNNAGYSIVTLGTTDTFGYLYDSNMNLLDVSDNQLNPGGINFELRYELTAGSTYYIKVTHKSETETGDYTLKITGVNYDKKDIEPNNSFGTAVSLSDFATVQADISTAGDEDFYKVTVSGGGSFSFETSGGTDTLGYLYDSNYNLIASDDNSGEENNMKIVSNLSGQQIYYVKVCHSSPNGTGSYSLLITPPNAVSSTDWEGGDDFSTAIDLATENYFSYSGAGINYSGDVDIYKFTPQVDGIYTFQNPYTLHGRANVYGEVYDSSLTLLKSDANSSSAGNFQVDVELTADQTYYLKVAAPAGNTGVYGIDIARGKCLSVPQYLQLPYDMVCWATASSMAIAYFNNDTLDRTVMIAKDCARTWYAGTEALYGADYYTYPSVFNQPAHLLNCGSYINASTAFDVEVSVWENMSSDPRDSTSYSYSTNELIKSINSGYPIIVKVQNSAGGNHCLIVKGYKYDANGLNVIYNDPLDGQEHISVAVYPLGYVTFYPTDKDLEPNDTTDVAIHLSSDTSIQGSIGKTGDVDCYRFSAAMNDHYTLETTGTTDTYAELYDSNGNLIASADAGGEGSNFKIQCHLAPYQTYYLKVSHSGSGTGSYTLTSTYTHPL
ncbi:pre-peptidase C-terminal domain-containing protein [Anaeromicropila populeti]|uniref:Pre-peptidase C-terminal domain-containing protein n=1 Tax=Anaeromicropila populeti TaxID=37658 RepID=A0A1I6ISU1_9FIRM|nr:pre-peptidase C-terminal domain-containing protein [Anaeromicropila populeti]SFR69802.1 pre-peptidase C-terminal domain-containing protein [Anaeromicropila populeti]